MIRSTTLEAATLTITQTMELVTHLKMLKPFNNNTQLEVAYKTLNLLPNKISVLVSFNNYKLL